MRTKEAALVIFLVTTLAGCTALGSSDTKGEPGLRIENYDNESHLLRVVIKAPTTNTTLKTTVPPNVDSEIKNIMYTGDAYQFIVYIDKKKRGQEDIPGAVDISVSINENSVIIGKSEE